MSDEPAYISIGSMDPGSFDEAATLLCGDEPRVKEPAERSAGGAEREHADWRRSAYNGYGRY